MNSSTPRLRYDSWISAFEDVADDDDLDVAEHALKPPEQKEQAPEGQLVRERFSRHLLRHAVEDFGSQTHLARALGITREQLKAWMSGEEEIPLWVFQAVADLLQARKKPPE